MYLQVNTADSDNSDLYRTSTSTNNNDDDNSNSSNNNSNTALSHSTNSPISNLIAAPTLKDPAKTATRTVTLYLSLLTRLPVDAENAHCAESSE